MWMKPSSPLRTSLLSTTVGAAIGYAILHPVTMVIYHLDRDPLVGSWPEMLGDLLGRLATSFHPTMSFMALHFVVLGSAFGLAVGRLILSIARRQAVIQKQELALRRDIRMVLQNGEDEGTEYKSSLRWDTRAGKVSRQVEHATLKSLAGFMNCRGGTLVLGVSDEGAPLGLQADLNTLKRRDEDGFEQYLIQMASLRIGTRVCPGLHVMFHEVDGRRVCRVSVEPAPEPVFVREGDDQQFFLRTGNATRNLNVEEAMHYISHHWPHRKRG